MPKTQVNSLDWQYWASISIWFPQSKASWRTRKFYICANMRHCSRHLFLYLVCIFILFVIIKMCLSIYCLPWFYLAIYSKISLTGWIINNSIFFLMVPIAGIQNQVAEVILVRMIFLVTVIHISLCLWPKRSLWALYIHSGGLHDHCVFTFQKSWHYGVMNFRESHM